MNRARRRQLKILTNKNIVPPAFFLYHSADMKIRIAAESDAEELLEIYAPYVKETAITFEYDVPDLQEFRSRIRRTLKNYPYYVAESEGKIAGYAYAGPFKERKAYDWAVETSIYVRKNLRRSGIGSALLEKLESTLAKQNILNANACIAQTDAPDAHLDNASIEFHAKKGYQLAGKFHACGYKFNHWYNMVWMEKMLGPHNAGQNPFVPFPNLPEQEK